MRLVADIGATFARFACVSEGGALARTLALRCSEFGDPLAAVAAYRAQLGAAAAFSEAVFAVASPVLGPQVRLTNHPWSLSADGLREALGVTRFAFLNDAQAMALALPRLGPDELRAVGDGMQAGEAPRAVIAVGTGLGMAGLVAHAGNWVALGGEGGHATFAPVDRREFEIARLLRDRFGHVSLERVLSGPGLVSLYQALCRLERAEPEALFPADVSARALDGSCRRCAEALRIFAAALGAAAGNLALTLGARGGVYLGGGIAARLAGYLGTSAFRARFEAKGRFADYLAAIPTRVILHPQPALLGALAYRFEGGV